MSADQGYKFVPVPSDYHGPRITRCPVQECQTDEIWAHHFESDTSSAWREVECRYCGAKWEEVYKFDHVERLQVRI
jgi:hypothetical protein